MRSAPSSASDRERDKNMNNNQEIIFPPLIATLDTYITSPDTDDKLIDNFSLMGKRSGSKKKAKGKKKKKIVNKINPLVAIKNIESYNIAREILEPHEYSESSRPDSRKFVNESNQIKSPNPPSPRKYTVFSHSPVETEIRSPTNSFHEDIRYQIAEKPISINQKQSPRSFARPLRVLEQPNISMQKLIQDDVSHNLFINMYINTTIHINRA